jgi:hypothetical protein
MELKKLKAFLYNALFSQNIIVTTYFIKCKTFAGHRFRLNWQNSKECVKKQNQIKLLIKDLMTILNLKNC